jgi:GNAT superfamily N-acetyltransferase
MRHPSRVTVLARLAVQGMTVTLRRAAAGDVPAIVDLLAADQLGATRDGVSSEEDLQLYRSAFDAIDADPAHLLVVAADGAQVIATMQMSFLPGLARRGALRAQIEAVRVRDDHRGRGLGAVLLQWALEEARRRHCALVQLTTDKSRADAHRFYERLGFVASHEGLKLKLLH